MFGEKLCRARTEKNLSQEQLAEKLFVTRQAVSRWENDKTQPDLQTLGRICSVLDVSADYFIDREVSTVNYKSLPYKEKLLLFYDFAKEFRRERIICKLLNVLSSLSGCGLGFTISFAAIDLIYGTWDGIGTFWLYIILGVVLLVALVVGVALFYSHKFSCLFNRWLSDKRITRTKRFL